MVLQLQNSYLAYKVFSAWIPVNKGAVLGVTVLYGNVGPSGAE